MNSIVKWLMVKAEKAKKNVLRKMANTEDLKYSNR